MWSKRYRWLSILCIVLSAVASLFLAAPQDWIPVLIILGCILAYVPGSISSSITRRSVANSPRFIVAVYGFCLILTGLISSLFAQVSIWASGR